MRCCAVRRGKLEPAAGQDAGRLPQGPVAAGMGARHLAAPVDALEQAEEGAPNLTAITQSLPSELIWPPEAMRAGFVSPLNEAAA